MTTNRGERQFDAQAATAASRRASRTLAGSIFSRISAVTYSKGSIPAHIFRIFSHLFRFFSRLCRIFSA